MGTNGKGSPKQQETIRTGAALAMAYKTPPGQVILQSARARVAAALQEYLDPTIPDGDILQKRQRLLGMLEHLHHDEQSIKMAVGFASRQAVQAAAEDAESLDTI